MLKIAFCTTCKGRTQHLKLTLPHNLLSAANYPESKFIILNYGSTDDLMEYLRTNHSKEIESGKIVVYTYATNSVFKMAHAKNMVHRLGIFEGADILVNLDADNYISEGFASLVNETFTTNPNAYMAIGEIVRGVTPRGVCGRIVVSSDAFLNTGGYDERFETWSPDDKDFNQRLKKIGYDFVEMESTSLECLRHNDKMRFKEYRHIEWCDTDSFEQALKQNTNTVVNFSDVGCGIVTKNFGMHAVRLTPIPTRIFGIGMHKTGTTSLHTAFKLLGFKSSGHWLNAHWAKRIWREMNTTGKSPTLERHYALCDMPIPTLFRQLDKGYPNSKFVLTVRNENEWLESVRKHWNPEINRFRCQWDNDPFTHIIHEKTYGQTEFDEKIFIEAYRLHNRAVLEHFKHRPGDLLVMSKFDWPQLCSFLNKKVPKKDFPHQNKNSIKEEIDYII